MIGSIANNRFLKRVNPEIRRALNETGAAASMRQMVDLDIAKNLVGWWHRDNVNTRVSGSDTFVTQANDSSGGINNAAQTTNDNQPKLVSLGMEFDGSDDCLDCDPITGNHSFAVCLWCKFTSLKDGQWLIQQRDDDAHAWQLAKPVYSSGQTERGVGFYVRGGSTNYLAYIDGDGTTDPPNDTWRFYVGVCDKENGRVISYLNGQHNETNDNLSGDITTDVTLLRIGSAWSSELHTDGTLNDIRIYNKALSATEIAAIYNQTKGAYGL